MSFKIKTEKILLLQVKNLIQIIVKFRTIKLCTVLSSTSHSLRGPQNVAIEQQVLSSWLSIWAQSICLTISEKSIMAYTFLHHGGARMCQKSQQTRHTKKIVY